jgi:hypothetical protein
MKLINSSIVFVFDGEVTLSAFINETLNQKILVPEIASKQIIHVPVYPIIIDLDNGYSMQISSNKLIMQIIYPEPHQIDNIGSLPDRLTDIANNFVKLKKELNYQALGINFKILIPSESFWLSIKELQNQAAIVDLKYKIKKEPFLVINRITQNPNEKKENNELEILLDSNFHLELTGSDEKEQLIKKAITQRDQCFMILKELINATFTKVT